MEISVEIVKSIFPASQDPITLAQAINDTLDKYGIDTPKRAAMFLAQAAHESDGFTRFEENLNYSAQSLRRVFPRYFQDDATAAAYAHQPEKIANRVYANRMGNGDEASGDGWLHRGGGAIQLTGQINQRLYGLAAYGDERFTTDPSPLRALPDAVLSAGWFWQKNDLNHYADAGDFDGVCDIVNFGHKTAAIGDSIGYQDRLSWFNRITAALPAA